MLFRSHYRIFSDISIFTLTNYVLFLVVLSTVQYHASRTSRTYRMLPHTMHYLGCIHKRPLPLRLSNCLICNTMPTTYV